MLDEYDFSEGVRGKYANRIQRENNVMTSWAEIINFYEDLRGQDGWEEFPLVAKFVEHLVQSRDLQGIYPFTSHMCLCLSRFETHKDWFEKPKITIEINLGASESYKYKFSLIQSHKDGDVLREFVESVFCSFEKSLEIFDEMISKLEKVS